MSIETRMREVAERAKRAALEMMRRDASSRAHFLSAIDAALAAAEADVLRANGRDLERARAAGMSCALQDRLRLDEARFGAMRRGVHEVAELPDVLGQTLQETVRPNGLRIVKRRVPLGVVAIVYEARPNVTVDSAILCLKTGNAVILRGGSDAFETNRALAHALSQAAAAAGFPSGAVQYVEETDRDAIRALVVLDDLIDVVIPRGGEGLIRFVMEHARVPVVKHYKGVCHVYVAEDADLEMAVRVIENAKCQRPGVCNALETLLVDERIADALLPKLAPVLEARNVEIRTDAAAAPFFTSPVAAVEEDWSAEYLELILSIRVVSGDDAAIEHINHFGSHHSDAILTRSSERGEDFCMRVDSAAVYVNASTRFTDGNEFGLGAEIGISTDKLHARGPMGLEELTTYKYIVVGNGQVRG